MRFLAGFFLSILLGAAGTPVATWKPAVSTEQVPNDPDDPAIWINREEPARSVIIGTNKAAAPNGALVVFDLSGKKLQTISGLDRPNNVDLRQNVHLGNRILDIVAVTERNQRALRFYEVERATRQLKELGSVPVFEGEQGEAAAPMGVALYVRPSDRVLFVVLSRKNRARRRVSVAISRRPGTGTASCQEVWQFQPA